MAEVIQEAELIRIAGVQKCRWRIIAPHRWVKWLVHFRDFTAKVQGATGLPMICIEPMAQDVSRVYG